MTEGKVWGKKKTWIVVASLLVMCAVGVIIVLVVNKNNPERIADENIVENVSASEISEKIEDKFNNELDYSLSDAINEYESAMSSGPDTYRVYIAIYYATFIYDNNGDIDEAVDILKRVESLVDDSTAGDYYVTLRQLYGDAGMNEKAEFYNQKVLELIPKDTRPVEELTKSAEIQE